MKLFDSNWNEITEYDLFQEIIYSGEEYIPYNAIAYCNGVEFARLDFADKNTIYSEKNPLKISINSFIGGELPKDIGYYDISYTFWYDKNTPKDLPDATSYSRYCPSITVVIDTDFDYSLRLYDNGNEITDEEYTVKYTGNKILPEVSFFRGEELALSYSLDNGYTYNANYGNQYSFKFFINNFLILETNNGWAGLKNIPLEVGRYEISYMLYREYSNISESRSTDCRKRLILNIVE